MSTIAEQMEADALEAMKLVRKHFVVEFDFSAESVRALENLFDDVDFALPGGKTQENIERLTRVWGAYLGEVIRRQRDGQWVESAESAGSRPIMRIEGTDVRPHDQIRQRLLSGAEHSVWDFYQSLGD